MGCGESNIRNDRGFIAASGGGSPKNRISLGKIGLPISPVASFMTRRAKTCRFQLCMRDRCFLLVRQFLFGNALAHVSWACGCMERPVRLFACFAHNLFPKLCYFVLDYRICLKAVPWKYPTTRLSQPRPRLHFAPTFLRLEAVVFGRDSWESRT